VWPIRLKARGRVGPSITAAVGAEAVTHAGAGFAQMAPEIAARLVGKPHWRQSLDLDGDLAAARRPKAKMHATRGQQFGADRQTPLAVGADYPRFCRFGCGLAD